MNTSYLSVVSPNAGKYGPEITPYLDNFHAVLHLSKTVLKNGNFITVLQWFYHSLGKILYYSFFKNDQINNKILYNVKIFGIL